MSAPILPNVRTSWLRAEGPGSDVVISSRIRLARNFAGFPFPNHAGRVERVQVLELAERHILGSGLAPEMAWVELADLSPLERSVLVERHLISKQHSRGDGPRALAVSSPDERLAIMINEEDHLRVQVMRPGLALREAFEQADEADNRIEAGADYAYSPRFGYLTACPTNVGTGIRVSVMLHLPALRLTGELDKVKRAAKSMCLAVRGFYGEGSEAVGDLYQLSNQVTLGKTEADLMHEFERQVIPQVVEYERIARKALATKRRLFLEDQVYRALGTLRNARLLKTDESMQLLSLVRLGLVTALIDDVDPEQINQLLMLTQPAHLQRVLGRELDQAARRAERATLIRTQIARSADGNGA